MTLNDTPGAMAGFEQDPSQIPGYLPTRKLSVIALLSFISSLILCIPIITQFFGILFGIIGIVIVVKKPDSRKGMAFAISGIVISLLVLLAYFGLAMLTGNFIQHLPNSSNQFFTNLQSGNTTEARLWLDVNTEQAVTDSDLKVFFDHLTTDYGQFKNAQIYWSFQPYQILKQPDIPDQFVDAVPVPLTLEFDKGTIHVLAVLKQNVNTVDLNNMFLIERIYFIPPNAKVWQFPQAAATTQPGTPTNQTPPDTNATPPPDKPDTGG